MHQSGLRHACAEVSHVRSELCACLTARGDALFGLCDAPLCTDGPVRTLVDLALAPEHRRGHGALYGGLDQGRIDVARLRRALARVPLPRADGWLVLAVDVSPWLRPNANTYADRAFCHTSGRGEGKHQTDNHTVGHGYAVGFAGNGGLPQTWIFCADLEPAVVFGRAATM